MVAVLHFLLGLLIGVILLGWQRSRFNARLKRILRNLEPETAEFPFAPASQLALTIAHRQEAQQELEQQLETYRSILQTAPIGYLQVDDENRLIWCNLQARNLLGIPDTHPAKPRLLLELVRSYELDDLIEQTRNVNKPCQSNWTFYPVSADPSYLSQQQSYALRGYGIPLLNHQIGIFLENRQEAVTLTQQRDRWASDLAHELKTPLTSIRLVAETLRPRLDSTLSPWIDRLIKETVRLSNLVQDLLDLNQMDRSSFQTLQLKPSDLIKLVHSVWSSLEPLARKKHLSLDYDGPEQLLVQIDEPRIHRLLVNLLDNSIKYSPPDQPIRVQVSLETRFSEDQGSELQQICLDVIDSGSGFPEKALPHVFERFYRADPSRARPGTPERPPSLTDLDKNLTHPPTPIADRTAPTDWQPQGGSGLGLAIVRQIVEAHHGSVSASNHPETGGAWLQVRLPWRSPEGVSGNP